MIISACAAIGGVAAVTTINLVRDESTAVQKLSEEQRATRENFFGNSKAPVPIEKGQEMRPRW